MNSVALAESRSLAYHREVADRLRANPELLANVRKRVNDWLASGLSPHYAHEWDRVLAQPLAEIIGLLLDEGEYARAMRQATPFAGTLSPKERWRIWREVRDDANLSP